MNYLLSVIVFSPMIGILVLLFIHKDKKQLIKWTGTLATVPPLFLCVTIYIRSFLEKQVDTFREAKNWIALGTITDHPVFSIQYELKLSGLSLAFLTLAAILLFLGSLLSWQISRQWKGYFLLFLFLEVGILGLFAAGNFLLFFLFFEWTLVTMFFLIRKWGRGTDKNASFQFLLYNGAGSALLLLAIIILFVAAGTMNFDQLERILLLNSGMIPEFLQWVVFIFLFLAFAVKLPVVPLHQWMVSVHNEAHPAVVIIHSGILLKIAAYGFIRFGMGLFPEHWQDAASVFLTFAIINLFYGAFLALRQTELRKIWAYSSISHMGFVLLGLSLFNQAGVQGAVFQSVSHGFISGILFLMIAIFTKHFGTTDITHISNLKTKQPFAAFLLFAGGMAALGLPGTSGFISEFTVIAGAFQGHLGLGIIAAVSLVFTALYVLRAILTISYPNPVPVQGDRAKNAAGPGKSQTKTIGIKAGPIKYSVCEWLPALVFLALIIGLGVFPQWLIEIISDPVTKTVFGIGG